MTDFGSLGLDGYGMDSVENRIGGLASKINHLETMSESGVPYDELTAQSNPVANPNAGGVNPQQAQNFQAMMQMMQAQMLSSGMNNGDSNNNSALGNMMQNPMFGMMMGGAGMQGMGQFGMNGMMMPNAGMMPANGGMNMPLGMGSIDPSLLQQNANMQMFEDF